MSLINDIVNHILLYLGFQGAKLVFGDLLAIVILSVLSYCALFYLFASILDAKVSDEFKKSKRYVFISDIIAWASGLLALALCILMYTTW